MKYFYAVKPKSAGQNNFTPPPAKKKSNWKLKVSWAGMYTNKKVDLFDWFSNQDSGILSLKF